MEKISVEEGLVMDYRRMLQIILRFYCVLANNEVHLALEPPGGAYEDEILLINQNHENIARFTPCAKGIRYKLYPLMSRGFVDYGEFYILEDVIKQTLGVDID